MSKLTYWLQFKFADTPPGLTHFENALLKAYCEGTNRERDRLQAAFPELFSETFDTPC